MQVTLLLPLRALLLVQPLVALSDVCCQYFGHLFCVRQPPPQGPTIPETSSCSSTSGEPLFCHEDSKMTNGGCDLGRSDTQLHGTPCNRFIAANLKSISQCKCSALDLLQPSLSLSHHHHHSSTIMLPHSSKPSTPTPQLPTKSC